MVRIGTGGPPDEEVLIVQSQPVMHAITTLFRLAWANAQEYAHAEKQAVLPADELRTQVVRLLTTGQKDVAAARELGLSVRTYRRHVAELMQSLDADSRFQAGVHAARFGLLSGGGRPD